MKQFLIGTGTTSSVAMYLHPTQREQEKKPISQFLPRRALTIYFPSCCLGVQLPVSLHLGADCNPPLWNARQISGYPQLFGATKNKGNLDNHKSLRDTQELRPGWLVTFISYTRSLRQERERWLFYLMHRNKYRAKENEETREYVGNKRIR